VIVNRVYKKQWMGYFKKTIDSLYIGFSMKMPHLGFWGPGSKQEIALVNLVPGPYGAYY
jgi:hypothetical protein